MVGREFLPTLVDIRSEGGYAHGTTFIHQFGYFGDVVKVAAHHGSHIFGRVVSLEVCRLISHPRIACGMTLVEGIGGELLPVAPYLFEHSRIMSVFLSTLDKLWFHGIYDGLLLLSHCLSQSVALSTCEVGKLARQKHHLLLIYRDSVCVLQIFLHAGDVVLYLLAPVFACDERGDIVHRSRSVEGIHGDDVLEDGWLQFAQVFLHTWRLKLECAYGASFGIQSVGVGIVDGDIVEVNHLACCYAYVLHCLL